jgi:peptide deformylase
MAVLPVRIYPDPVLRQKAPAVDTIDATIQRLLDDMIETMYAAPGIGLAAPQVGVSLRLFVVDPEICHAEGRMQEDEGCLSFPGVYGPTPRAARVRLRGMNRAGETVEVEGEGLLARAFQHEMDHLDGRLFFNRMGPMGRDIVMRKFKRAQRQHQHDH